MKFHTSFDPATCIWSGLPTTPLYNPNASVADVVFGALQRRPGHIGQISETDGSRLCNGELRQLAIRVALSLQRLDRVRKGDVVGLVVRNHRLTAAVMLGCVALAAPVSTLDPDFNVGEISHMLGITTPKVLFCDADNVATVRLALAKTAIELVLYTIDRRVPGEKCVDDLIVPSTDAADEEFFLPTAIGDGTRHPVAIICSSGTTGPSKGVSISHALLLRHLSEFREFVDDDITFTFSSLYWLSGLTVLIGSCMNGITRVITASAFDPELMVRIVSEYGVTALATAPSHLAQLLQSPNATAIALRTLNNYFCGGSGVPVELVQRIDRLLPAPLRVTYGLSEVAGMVTCNRAGRTVSGSAGLLSAGVRVQLRRDDGSLCSTHDDDGEICVQLGLPMLGYWGDRVATASAIDASGWLCTGDVGHFDAAGNLFIVDRKKDILKYRNKQISPSEVENVVLRVPGVAEVCVVGVEDEMGCDLVTAVVVRQAGAVGEALDATEIEAEVAQSFSDARRLHGGVFFVDQLPMTPSGKIVRRKVRELVMQLRK